MSRGNVRETDSLPWRKLRYVSSRREIEERLSEDKEGKNDVDQRHESHGDGDK